MSVICTKPSDVFSEVPFKLEKDFEAKVIEFADAIFGESSIYLDVKKRVKGNDVISIPDGYLIDMADPENPLLFIIENEISTHDPLKHVGIQMLRFVTSFDDAQTDIRNFLMDAITRDEAAEARLQAGCDASSKRNIDNYLDSAVYAPFKGLVLIDTARPELHNVLKRINANISVLEFKTFENGNGQEIYQFDTLYEELDAGPSGLAVEGQSSEVSRRIRKERRAKSDTIIVPAHKEGFERVFIGENCWHAIRVGAAMKDKIKYIAAYQIRPISAVTHIAEVQSIEPYGDDGKYKLVFSGPAEKLKKPLKLKDYKRSPQSPVYSRYEEIQAAKTLDEALT